MEFDEQLKQVIQQRIIKDVKDHELLKFDYSQKFPVPKELLDKIYGSINWDEVVEQIRPEIQTRICNTIVASLETELKTDIKKVLSIDGVRRRLRTEVYPKLMQVLDNKC